ncbi:MAG: DUF881 domain-containing protein [Saccharofermentanales bacterium]|jgi:uncharacterized protein YlxW (UPF0749 family)
MKKKSVQYAVIILVGVVIGMVIALLMKSLNVSETGGQRLQELQNVIIDYQKKNEELNTRNATLYEYLRELESDVASGEGEVFVHIVEEKEQFAIFAGLRPARNTGIIMTVAPQEGYKMQDAVVRQFVNELSALGAQAIAINGERKVATTEIRTSQDNLLINGVAFSRESPFEIRAIIAPEKIDSYVMPYLESVGENIRKQVGEDQLLISVTKDDSVLIPALNEDRISYQLDLLTPVE